MDTSTQNEAPVRPDGGAPPAPDKLLQLGLGFWSSKTLLSAVELDVFTQLAQGPARLDELSQSLGLHMRSAADFLDALVALGILERRDGHYSNSREADLFLDRAKPTYVGGILEMANARLYHHWGSLTEGLRTGRPQNEAKQGGEPFAALYSDPQRMRGFLQAMTAISMGAAKAIAAKFPWSEYKTFSDIGTAQGGLPAQIALKHEHVEGVGFDLAAVQPYFEEYVHSFGLRPRLNFHAGNFFEDPLPETDVLVMGHILHDWNLEEKLTLLSKAAKALPKNGALVVYDAVIDDDRRANAFGLLASLNMLIETQGGFDYTGTDCCGWMKKAGFRETRVEHLTGPDSMVVGIK